MALKEISILHRKIRISICDKERLKGISIGEKLSYTFYEGVYQDIAMIFLEPRKGNPTPKECEITSGRIMALLGVPVVFILKPGPTYERQRLTDKGVYFVMSGRRGRRSAGSLTAGDGVARFSFFMVKGVPSFF